MRRIGLLGLMLLLGAVLATSPAYATVFWDDDFEGPALNDNFGGTWGLSSYCNPPNPPEGCNPYRINNASLSHSGTHSLWSHYESLCGMSADPACGGLACGCGSYIGRLHPTANNVYMRWWTKFVNGEANQQTGSKQFYNKSLGTEMLIFWHIFPGTTTIGAQFTHNSYLSDCPIPPNNPAFLPSPACNVTPNQGNNSNIFDGQWHCVETHVDAGTAGGANGIAEAWVDGVLSMRYTGLSIRPPSSPGGWDLVTHYAQVGNGERYVDQVAVGDSRIGCGGTVSVGSPSAPAGLLIR